MEKSKSNVNKTIQEDSFYLETTHKIYFQDAINLKKLKEKTVHLVVTSPPYWKIKDYGNEEQIGYNDSLTEYFDKLNAIWKECLRVLHPGCKLCINIGDQFLRAIKNKRVYQIVPLHSHLINDILRDFGDDETIVVYTNENSMKEKLEKIDGCLKTVDYTQKEETVLVAVDFYFPIDLKKKLKKELKTK